MVIKREYIKRDIVVSNRKEFMDSFRKLFIPNHSVLFPGSNINDDFNIGYALNNWTMFFFWNDKSYTIFTTVELIEGVESSTKEYLYKDKSLVSEEYIAEQMKRLSMNIDEIKIGQSILDKDGSVCEVTNKQINSVEVYIPRKSKEGISSKQYFDMRNFNDRFKIK